MSTPSKYGAKTKASKGQKKYAVYNFTMPPELAANIERMRKPGEKTSHLFVRLLTVVIKCQYYCIKKT